MRRATAEVATSRWSAISPRPCRWTLPAEWKSAEISASRQQPRVGAIAASSARRSSESGMALEPEEPALVRESERAVAADPAGADDPMAREEQPEAVLGAEAPRRTRGARIAGELGQLAVGDDLAPRHSLQHVRGLELERGCALEVELEVDERDALPGEVAVDSLQQILDEGVTLS